MGDVSRLIEAVRRSVEERVEARVREARSAAEEIVRRSFESALDSALKRIEEEARRLRERLAALEAAKTVELRKAVSKAKSSIVDEIVREAFIRFREMIGEEGYRSLIARLASEAAKALNASREKVVLIPVERDRGVVEQVARELRSQGMMVEVAGESIEGLGGFMAYSPGTGVRLDYKVEEVFSQAFEEARAVALKALFG